MPDIAIDWTDTHRVPRQVIWWDNGMIMVFDEAGDQITDLQGKASLELAKKIKGRADDDTEWYGFGDTGPVKWGEHAG